MLFLHFTPFNMLRVLEHDPLDRRGLHNAWAKSEKDCLQSQISKPSCTSNAKASSGTKIRKNVRASKILQWFDSGIVSPLFFISMWKCPWNFASRLERPIRLERDIPCLNPQQKGNHCVRQPGSFRLQLEGRRRWRFSQSMFAPSQCNILLWEPIWLFSTTPPPTTFHQLTAPVSS